MKIAISGKSGCGNSTVSRLVSERLGLKLINLTFRDLAAERGMSFVELHDLAGRDPSIDRELDRRQVAAAAAGPCVLGSRLAIWLLADVDFAVYLRGTPEVRARRIAARDRVPFATALAEMNRRDASDRRRYLDLYGIDVDRYEHAHLVVDTTTHDQFRAAAAIVAAATRITR